MVQKLFTLLGVVILLSACAASPEKVAISHPDDERLSCSQLRAEMDRAQRLKVDARKEDRFKMRYIAIVPAIVSLVNMNEAEKAAEARYEHLHLIYSRKQCMHQYAPRQ